MSPLEFEITRVDCTYGIYGILACIVRRLVACRKVLLGTDGIWGQNACRYHGLGLLNIFLKVLKGKLNAISFVSVKFNHCPIGTH